MAEQSVKNTGKKQGFVLWLTGLSGAGKSTIAQALAARLEHTGQKVERLDGDVMRSLFPGTGFTREDRDEHIKRIGFMASRLEHHGVVVVASFISPYRQSRQAVRKMCKNFIEVYVMASLETCQKRDVKGLYKKALAGEIKNFTGLDDPYEQPEKPELVIDTDSLSVEQSVERITEYIRPFM